MVFPFLIAAIAIVSIGIGLVAYRATRKDSIDIVTNQLPKEATPVLKSTTRTRQ